MFYVLASEKVRKLVFLAACKGCPVSIVRSRHGLVAKVTRLCPVSF